jgi:XTP/dITP diphosphohydrolase
MVPLRLVLATANPDKGAEIARILEELAPFGAALTLLARPAWVGEVDETGATLEENARLKAEALVAATGEAAMADDTGLEVEALHGAPGIYAARYAGEAATYADNVAKLLSALSSVPSGKRVARFRTVALARFADGTELVAEGVADGEIATEPRGSYGFGYDPVFIPVGGDGRTFAEMSPDEKRSCSHRARAFTALLEKLAARIPGGSL